MTRLVIYEEVADEETIFELFDLTTHRVLIGSGLDNDLVLDAAEVEPVHASLELRHHQWVLQDLGSRKGTMVNAKKINGPYYLQEHDLIEIGSIKLRFQAEESGHLEIEEKPAPGSSHDNHPPLKGRVWFAMVAGVTVAIIFIIILLLIIADYLALFELTDLLPPWLYRGN